MHKSEPKANLTLITRASKEYELKVRTIRAHWLPQNSILKLIHHLYTLQFVL